MTIKSGIDGTTLNSFLVGDGVDSTKYIYVNNGDAYTPGIRYNASTSVFQVSNDGINWFDLLSQSDTPIIITHQTTSVNNWESATPTIDNQPGATTQYQVYTTIRNDLDINCHLSVCDIGITEFGGTYKFIGQAGSTLTAEQSCLFLETDDALNDVRFSLNTGTGLLTFQYKSSAIDAYATSIVLYGSQLSGFVLVGGSGGDGYAGISTLTGDVTAGPAVGVATAKVVGIDNKLIYPDPSAVAGNILVLRGSSWIYELTTATLPLIFGHRLSSDSSRSVPLTDNVSNYLYLIPHTHSYFHLYGGGSSAGWYLCEVSSPITIDFASNLDCDTKVTSIGMHDVFIHSHDGGVTFKWDFFLRTFAGTPSVDIVMQNGTYVLNTDRTKRWVGCVNISINFSGFVIVDYAVDRGVWNLYNRVERQLAYVPTTLSWNCPTYNEWSVAENGLGCVKCINGLLCDSIHMKSISLAAEINVLSTNSYAASGFGLNSTTVNSALVYGTHIPSDSRIYATNSFIDVIIDQGPCTIYWLEITDSVFVAFVSNYSNSALQSGICGYFLM